MARALAGRGCARIDRYPNLQPRPLWAASEAGCICNEGQPPSSTWGHALRLQKLTRNTCIRSNSARASSRAVPQQLRRPPERVEPPPSSPSGARRGISRLSSMSSHPERRGARLRRRQPPQGVGPRRRGSVSDAQLPSGAPSPPTAVVSPPPARGSNSAIPLPKGRRDRRRHRDARFRLQQSPHWRGHRRYGIICGVQ